MEREKLIDLLKGKEGVGKGREWIKQLQDQEEGTGP